MKLAQEIGAASAARRLEINVDTLYTWQNKEKKRAVIEATAPSDTELTKEVIQLRRKLKEQEEEIEIHFIEHRFDQSSIDSLPITISGGFILPTTAGLRQSIVNNFIKSLQLHSYIHPMVIFPFSLHFSTEPKLTIPVIVSQPLICSVRFMQVEPLSYSASASPNRLNRQ